MPVLRILLLAALLVPLAPQAHAGMKVVVDLDLGESHDDPFALGLILSDPSFELVGVTSSGAEPRASAMIACRFLWLAGRKDVPVAVGSRARSLPPIDPAAKPAPLVGQYQYGFRATPKYPIKESAVDFLYAKLKAEPEKVAIVCLGPLTNLADLFEKHPDSKRLVRSISAMGGSLKIGYSGKGPAEPEWNIKSDIPAAKAVFASGQTIILATLDTTAALTLDDAQLARVNKARGIIPRQIQALWALGDGARPTLFDPLAAALIHDERFTKPDFICIEIDDKGMTREVSGRANASVATQFRRDAFLEDILQRVAVSPDARPFKAPANPTKAIPRGGFPARVHVVEDYETDIERRWWLAGIPETKNVPPGSTRACRGVPVNDFDDKQGDASATYTGVIFNPVPGPPMGPATRLSFRYWLKGTERLRVQIYSLSNGYHRHLTLTGLPQGKWESATVDMTQCRRPDGSGGALAADERIDDIQFYTDLGAELIVDDVLLYDEAAAGEKRPFPRVLFTGWFDTGKQGVEWPGEFATVPHEKPRAWKAAASIADAKGGPERLKVSLRGARKFGAATLLSCAYRLDGADRLDVVLVSPDGARYGMPVEKVEAGKWSEALLDFGRSRGPEGKPPAAGQAIDAVDFVIPVGGKLLVDNLLLYEPGS